MDISIIIPVFNQLHYTKLCIESIQKTLPPNIPVIIINNGSSDGTREYLSAFPSLTVINNEKNLGCAAAWNQGVIASSSEWVIILNNDVVLPARWLEGLFSFALERRVDIASPAIREGELMYDMEGYAEEYMRRMRDEARMGVAHGVCFMVKKSVFKKIGIFDENFRIGQFEDSDFFRRAKAAGFSLGTTGRSFIHHFGSVTQNMIRVKKEKSPYESENRAYFRRKWRLTWWRRFLERNTAKLRAVYWRLSERSRHGHALMEKWTNGRLYYF